MKGDKAIVLYEKFNAELNKYVESLPGVFGADMEVSITNSGPVNNNTRNVIDLR